MGQSRTFIESEANNYFSRNKFKRTFVADYLLSRIPRQSFANFDIAEFGIGGGQNLMLLKSYARHCHGYDGSSEGIRCFREFFETSPDWEYFHAAQVNLCEPFETPISYDLILYGFFAYYVTDEELTGVKKNLLNALKPNGLLFVYDFLTRESLSVPDSRNDQLKVYKRSLSFWMSHLHEFDLLDFRLFYNDRIVQYKFQDQQNTIDLEIPEDDREWNFGAVFRRRATSE